MKPDPRIQEVAQRLADRIGAENVAAIIKGFVSSYGDAARRKATGEELPEQIQISIPADIGSDQESRDLVEELLALLLESAQRRSSGGLN